MASSGITAFGQQLWALLRKNLLVAVVRRPVSFLLLCYGFPLAILAVLLSIPSFLASSNGYGVGSPAPIKDLADVLHGKKLVVVRPSGLGADVHRVADAFTSPLDQSLVRFLGDDDDLLTECLADTRGVSGCFAAVSFEDSPESDGGDGTWKYTIRIDPAKTSSHFDVAAHKSVDENTLLPVQLAVNNAIANSTGAVPQIVPFTAETSSDHKLSGEEGSIDLVEVYTFIIFACYFSIIYRFTSLITSDRESGMAQLVDAMGGSGAAAARVLAWLLIFDISCLPCFVAFGVLLKRLIFFLTPVSHLIGWQIVLGLAVNSSTVFAAAFFKKSRVSAIYVIGAFLLLSVGSQIYSFQIRPLPQPAGVFPLTVLFPSANFVFFFQQMCLWELSGMSANFNRLPVASDGINSTSYEVTQTEMLGFLGAHIIIYPILAIVVEKAMHGIDFRHRSFAKDSAPLTGGVVAETFDLKKCFVPGILEKMFCCGKRRPVNAVNGVSLKGHKGQILCLVGPNGSGKTTTLHMMSGLASPSSGTVSLDALPSQIGLCPQRNTLWDELTVEEHISLWNKIKSSRETPAELYDLASACDLDLKRKSRAGTLSGGQKRKLQLACMFVGGSTLCLIDECTSGLDPLSRRVIWEVLLQQRAKRSIIFTTHFLDEVDVLADHIVILSKGKIKCQGTSAELKNLYGGGYKVLVPRSAASAVEMQYPVTEHQDRLIFHTPDSRSAARLSSALSAAGVSDIAINGPQVEDVFLRVADDVELEPAKTGPLVDFHMTPGQITSFWSQVGVLFGKRVTLLKRFWFPYFYVLLLPLIITPFLNKVLFGFELASCSTVQPELTESQPVGITWASDCNQDFCPKLAVGPSSASDTLQSLVVKGYQEVSGVDESQYDDFVELQDSRNDFLDFIPQHRTSISGGVFMGSNSSSSLIAYELNSFVGISTGVQTLSLWSQIRSGVEIIITQSIFAQTLLDSVNTSSEYVIFFVLIQAFYPAAFVLYPAIEKTRKIRLLQYSNGVRRGPLWVAYGMFDSIFVIIIAIVTTVILNLQLPWNGPVWIMVPILALYGFCSTLLGYVVSHFVSGPLRSFLAAAAMNLVMYAIAAVAFGVTSGYSSPSQFDSATLGITFGLNLILPIGNLYRAMLIGLNLFSVGCRNGQPTAPQSIYGYGGPILYLVLQTVILLFVIVWIEGDLALFRRKRVTPSRLDAEKTAGRQNDEVEAESIRVEQSDSDLLRVLHVDRSFGSNHAVDNVSFGLPQGDVMALIGPNGAGKSTLVNLVQSELSVDHGKILLCGEDARTRSAQRFLGVCPQFDALDMMNTKEHLTFYAKIKGIKDISGNVNYLMEKLNLTPHASTLGSKLSGGNKRKLSLAIALLGTPPVLVLDEPTSAMDAVAKRSFWKIILEITPGRSVLLTTHSMEEADTLATRAAIISKRLLAVGTTQALREKYSNVYYVELVLSSAPNSNEEEMLQMRSWVHDNFPGAQLEREVLGGQVRFTIPGATEGGRHPVARAIDVLEGVKDQVGIEYYSIGGATLERVFLSVVKENSVQEEDGSARPLWRTMFLR